MQAAILFSSVAHRQRLALFVKRNTISEHPRCPWKDLQRGRLASTCICVKRLTNCSYNTHARHVPLLAREPVASTSQVTRDHADSNISFIELNAAQICRIASKMSYIRCTQPAAEDRHTISSIRIAATIERKTLPMCQRKDLLGCHTFS